MRGSQCGLPESSHGINDYRHDGSGMLVLEVEIAIPGIITLSGLSSSRFCVEES